MAVALAPTVRQAMRGSASPKGEARRERAAKPERSKGRGREDYGWGWAGGVIKPNHPTNPPPPAPPNHPPWRYNQNWHWHCDAPSYWAVLDDSVQALLNRPHTLVLWLTGAGISAESGIPTFRGKEGYWRVGSRNYQPEELATRAAFQRMPEEVWAWYLYRRGVCQGAQPNAAHLALVNAEQRCGDRFLLVTQNVDGLHLRAGNTLDRTYQIHGNIDFMRCTKECLPAPVPIPDGVELGWEKGRALGDQELDLLRCPSCGAMTRPHVLWFDEIYDEPNFRFQSSIEAARHASLVIVVGTTGATSLPMHIGTIVAQRGVPMIVVNPVPNPFSALLQRTGVGAFLPGTAGNWVPELADALPSR